MATFTFPKSPSAIQIKVFNSSRKRLHLARSERFHDRAEPRSIAYMKCQPSATKVMLENF